MKANKNKNLQNKIIPKQKQLNHSSHTRSKLKVESYFELIELI